MRTIALEIVAALAREWGLMTARLSGETVEFVFGSRDLGLNLEKVFGERLGLIRALIEMVIEIFETFVNLQRPLDFERDTVFARFNSRRLKRSKSRADGLTPNDLFSTISLGWMVLDELVELSIPDLRVSIPWMFQESQKWKSPTISISGASGSLSLFSLKSTVPLSSFLFPVYHFPVNG
jgi:hypothetical protein